MSVLSYGSYYRISGRISSLTGTSSRPFPAGAFTVGPVTAYTGNFRLGPDTGRVVIKTGRAGLAAKAGHDLTIEVTRWSARVEVPADEDGGVTAATVTADLDLG